MLKKFLAIVSLVVIVIGILIGIIVWTLNSASATQYLLSSLIRWKFPQVQLQECHIQKQSFSNFDQLKISNLKIVFKIDEAIVDVYVSAIELLDLSRINFKLSNLKLLSRGIEIKSKDIQLNNLSIDANFLLKGFQYDHLNGTFVSSVLSIQQYPLSDLYGNFQADKNAMHIKQFETKIFDGHILGQIFLEYQKDLPYSITIQFNKLDLRYLKTINPTAYQNIEGVINGQLKVDGKSTQINHISVDAQIKKDGKINASLLNFVRPYIPNTKESLMFDEMVKFGKKVPVQLAKIELKNVEEDKLSGLIQLLVAQLNLNLNLPIDIKYDGNLYSLIQWYQSLIK